MSLAPVTSGQWPNADSAISALAGARVKPSPFVILSQKAVAAPPQAPKPLIPAIPLKDGEQYRFHFEMSKCIGCKCCEVACAEQNNLPPDISWRRVGEMEGGVYPNVQRLHLSMGCNHCLEPACLEGCPTDAYSKDATTGLVIHSAEMCIGCEYCVWNCPYGVPVFNEERGVVGKCDMCSGRILDGLAPACVNACPEQAIQVEIVNIEQWREEYKDMANAPGMPSADSTISTTRITMPANMPPELQKADYFRVRPEKPHYSLVGMTILTQLSIGAFSLLWLMSLLPGAPGGSDLSFAAYAALAVGLISFLASPLHLGRPIYAYRAMKMWRRSWLSREVVLLSGFGATATLYSAALWTGNAYAAPLGGVATVLGLCGVTATSFIYIVPARPAWNSKYTLIEFFLTAATLGALFAQSFGAPGRTMVYVAASAAGAQLMLQLLKFFWLTGSEEFELKASARLLSTELRRHYIARFALLIAGGIILPLLVPPALALLIALGGEVLGRYLFFVSVVPRNMAMSFFGLQQEAA